ncbi:hypothetical protein B566_EDAN017110 [Ephemera danica]|nr:hypothetical protein B566_EDAN017110 [Ephemera danica]
MSILQDPEMSHPTPRRIGRRQSRMRNQRKGKAK